MAHKILKPISTNRRSRFIGRNYTRHAWSYKERMWKMIAYEIRKMTRQSPAFIPTAVGGYDITGSIGSSFNNNFFLRCFLPVITLCLFLFFSTYSTAAILYTTNSQEKIDTYLSKKATNNISGQLTKIPSMTPGFGRVTLEDVVSKEKYSVLSDSITGNYSVSVPTGTYKTSIEFQSGIDTSTYMEKTIDINKDTTINFKNFPFIRAQSTYYTNKSILSIMRRLTATRGPPLDSQIKLSRAPNVQRYFPRRPNPSDPRSCPKNFEYSIDRARDSVLAAGKGKISYREADTDSTEGLSYIYYNDNEMTKPGALGITHPRYRDHVLYKVLVEINKTLCDSVSAYSVDLREKARSLGLQTLSLDDQYVTYAYGNPVRKFHFDEKKVIELTYSLDIGTDMSWYGNWYGEKDSLVTHDIRTSIDLESISSTIPEGYKISNPYPNPFNPETNIEFTIPKESHTKIKVYNILGQSIETLLNKRLNPGIYMIRFDGRDKPSGLYFIRIEADEYIETKQGILIK